MSLLKNIFRSVVLLGALAGSGFVHAGLIYTFDSDPNFSGFIELDNSLSPGLTPVSVTADDLIDWSFTWLDTASLPDQVFGTITRQTSGQPPPREFIQAELDPSSALNIESFSVNRSDTFLTLDGFDNPDRLVLDARDAATGAVAVITGIRRPQIQVISEPTAFALFAGGVLAFGIHRKLVAQKNG